MSDTDGRLERAPGIAPRLSIVIPCFNNGRTIAAQLSAVANQRTTYWFEVVVADNGSRDDSVAIARGFGDRISRLRVIDAGAWRGAAYARNAGANAAEGDALLFCDADDVMADGYLDAMGRALERHDFVACRYDFRRLNSSWLAAARGPAATGQEEGLAGGYCHPTLPYAGAGGLGIRKAAHAAVHGFDMSLGAMAGQEDTDYCVRVQLAGTRLVFVPDAIMHVRFRNTVAGVFQQAWAWAESGAHVQRRYQAVSIAPPLASMACDFARHLAWKLLRVRSREDVAQWIWLAGWCGGLLSARRTVERKSE